MVNLYICHLLSENFAGNKNAQLEEVSCEIMAVLILKFGDILHHIWNYKCEIIFLTLNETMQSKTHALCHLFPK